MKQPDDEATTEMPSDSGVTTQVWPISGVLRPYVNALMATELDRPGPWPMAVVPHESVVLSVQLGRSAHCVEQKGEHGLNTRLTGIREWTGAFSGAGNCVTLFALLTPLGVVQLLESQPLAGVARIRAPLAGLLDERLTRGLESDIAIAPTLQGRLHAFGAWLEARATAHRQLDRAAMRAARSAMRLCQQPQVAVETLADEQHVSRRQLERDFAHWIGTSPRHLSRVARVQAVSRRAMAGSTSLADIAADVGFADQAHMSRVVRQLTGLTPRRFVSAGASPLVRMFRRATGGGTVYV